MMSDDIKNIWKSGFTAENSETITRSIDFDARPSINLIDRFEEKYALNVKILFGAAVGMPLMMGLFDMDLLGTFLGIFCLLNAFLTDKYLAELRRMDRLSDTHSFLKHFQTWMSDGVRVMVTISRFFYPLFFVVTAIQFWTLEAIQEEVAYWLSKYPDIALINGVPVWLLVGAGVITVALFAFAPKLYRMDVKSFYGDDGDRLLALVSELETLKQES